jgi:hypothetical protein
MAKSGLGARASAPTERRLCRRKPALEEASPGVRGRLGSGAVQRPRDESGPEMKVPGPSD